MATGHPYVLLNARTRALQQKLHLVRTANLVPFLLLVLIMNLWPGVYYYLHTEYNSIIFYVNYCI
jgi:hypothetical protein